MDKKIVCNICGCVYFNENDHDDFYDCVEYDEVKRGVRKGQWMVDWKKRLNEQEPYLSDFFKWNKEFQR